MGVSVVFWTLSSMDQWIYKMYLCQCGFQHFEPSHWETNAYYIDIFRLITVPNKNNIK